VPVGKGKFGAAAAVMNTKLGTQHGKPASWQDIKTPGTTFSNFSSSANAAFISWYGWYGQAVSASGTTSRCNSTYTSCYQVGYNATIKQAAAEKFTGTGRVAKKIELGAFAIPNYLSCSYWNSCHTSVGNVGLYSNGTGAACSGTSRAGAPSCPGTAIHNASGNFSATLLGPVLHGHHGSDSQDNACCGHAVLGRCDRGLRWQQCRWLGSREQRLFIQSVGLDRVSYCFPHQFHDRRHELLQLWMAD
jgi:hypothetical protein